MQLSVQCFEYTQLNESVVQMYHCSFVYIFVLFILNIPIDSLIFYYVIIILYHVIIHFDNIKITFTLMYSNAM